MKAKDSLVVVQYRETRASLNTIEDAKNIY